MYIYDSPAAMVGDLKEYITRRIAHYEAQLESIKKTGKPNSQQAHNIKGQLAVYWELYWMMNDCTFGDGSPPFTTPSTKDTSSNATATDTTT